MALHRLVRKEKHTEDIKELIEKTLRQSVTPIYPLGPDDWFRVSSIGSVCPREEVLCAREGVVREDRVSPDLGMVFEMGHGIHWVMQNRVLGPTGRLIGSWRCTWCGEIYGSLKEGMVSRPDSCLRCGAIAADAPRTNNRPDKSARADAFVYMEQWVGDFRYKVGGHPDGFWVDGDATDFADDDVVVLEFKSASDKSFYKYAKSPDFMHVIQLQCYLWLTGYKRAKIIYINKAKFGMDALVQHDIKYDVETVERLQDAIKQIRAGVKGGAIPPRRACQTQDCSRARGCKVSDACFTN